MPVKTRSKPGMTKTRAIQRRSTKQEVDEEMKTASESENESVNKIDEKPVKKKKNMINLQESNEETNEDAATSHADMNDSYRQLREKNIQERMKVLESLHLLTVC